MPLLRDNPDDLQALIGGAAAARGIDQVFVEKDFWVVEVLRAATVAVDVIAKDGSRHEVRTIFKGGTSLSRVYGLIERFSEDVDLLIGFPDVDLSIGAKDKVLKGIRDAVTEHLGLDSAHVASAGETKGVKRYVRYHYTAFEHIGQDSVSSGVLLEMGCRGGTYPTQQHQLRSMAAEYAIEELSESPNAWDEFAPVEVEVLAPERTLLEKLALLHDGVARSPDEAADARLLKAGRHLYDVHRLLSNGEVISSLEAIGPEGVVQLCADIDEHSRTAEFTFTPRPTDGYAASPLLDPSKPGREVLGRGYDAAMTLVFGERPTFDDCMATIAARAVLL
jgi:hypothetical protein